MQKLTLGLRLGLAFGVLIVLICALGGLTIWRVNLAAASAAQVSEKDSPEVVVAHYVNIDAWETRFNIRQFCLTGDAEYLRKGRKALAEVYTHLKDADDLAKKYPDLVNLRQGAIEAREKTAEYEALVEKVETEFKNLAIQQAAFDNNGKMFTDAVQSLWILHQKHMNAELDEWASPVKAKELDANVDPTKAKEPDANASLAKLKERAIKISLVKDIADIGNAIQINNFKAQNARDMDSLRDVLKDFVSLEKAIATLIPLLDAQDSIEQAGKVREAAEKYKVAMEQVLKSQVAVNEHSKALVIAGGVVVDKANVVAEGGLKDIENAAINVAGGLTTTSLILIIGLIIALIVAVLVAWQSSRAITVPIREGVNILTATAAEISATVAQLASSATETAAAATETTATVEEVRQTAQMAADKAKAVADNSQSAARAAETGRQATDQTIEGLTRIRDQMGVIGESISRLNEQSQAVGDIVSTVTDLAEQSNLLAVNASIEAAKAGDMGKGFAVVAQEIRNLAEQSKDSTKQVRGILTEVQKATGKAVLSVEQGGKGVADGGKQAEEAGQAIKALTATVQDASRAAVQIAASSQQQLAGMEQVGRAMESIKQAATQNAEGSRQLGTAAHSLQEIGARLRALVGSGDGGANGERGTGKAE